MCTKNIGIAFYYFLNCYGYISCWLKDIMVLGRNTGIPVYINDVTPSPD